MASMAARYRSSYNMEGPGSGHVSRYLDVVDKKYVYQLQNVVKIILDVISLIYNFWRCHGKDCIRNDGDYLVPKEAMSIV